MSDHPYDRLINQRIDLLEATNDALDDSRWIDQTALGPITYEGIRYPYAETRPTELNYQGGNEYRHELVTTLVFERHSHESYTHLLKIVREAITDVSDAIGGVDCVVGWRPTRLQDFARELDNTLLIAVEVTWQIQTLVDMGDT